MKAVKIGIGIVLLVFSVIYIGVVSLVISERKERVGTMENAFLEVEYLGCENLGDTMVTRSGEEMVASEGYDYYRLTFTIRNLSSAKSWSDQEIYLDWKSYEDVVEVYYNDREIDYDRLFSTYAYKFIPGKVSITKDLYAMVRQGVTEIWVYYYPNWNEEEVKLPISLEKWLD